MYTEITWQFTVSKNGRPVRHGALTTIDLSYPARFIEQMGKDNAPCVIIVRDSKGETHRKEWP